MMKFPQGFLWGAATSAHQVEGNNVNNDWWEAEENGSLPEASGQACRHYQLYGQDFNLAKELNHNCHRLSIEWSRVEPQAGEFLDAEINHYAQVLRALRERNLEPIVTLHHFTNPRWFSRLGGWAQPRLRPYFLRFVERVVSEFASQVKYWVTINEPTVYAYHAYMLGAWPPKEKSFLKARAVFDNFAATHIKAYQSIHAIYKKMGLPSPLVGIAANLQAYEYCRATLLNKIAVYLREKFCNLLFIDKLVRRHSLDYIGLNYYGRNLADVRVFGPRNIFFDTCQDGHLPLKKNSLGWDIYPLGLYNLLCRLKKYKLPVLITENGVCTEDDSLRWLFINEHLQSVRRALGEGADVLGYIYWSLLDNFEWDKGFAPRFGLIHVDYHSYQRTIRESARRFAQVCKDNTV